MKTMEEIEILANGFYLKAFPSSKSEPWKHLSNTDIRKVITIMMTEFHKHLTGEELNSK